MDEHPSVPGDVLGLRKGKWTVEEENYANKIIQLFTRGLLPIVVGTTLRTYLSEKLNCDPMRITKKFAGASCIGKQVFQSCPRSADVDALILEGVKELEELEREFLHKLMSKGGGISHSGQTDASGVEANNFANVRNKYSSRYDINNSPKVEGEQSQQHVYFSYGSDRPAAILSKTSRPGLSAIAGSPRADTTHYDSANDTLRKMKRIKRAMSAPEFLSYDSTDSFPVPTGSGLATIHETTSSSSATGQRLPRSTRPLGAGVGAEPFSSFRKRTKRSHSVMDFEHYFSSDQAAGELLVEFYNGLRDTSSAPLQILTFKNGQTAKPPEASGSGFGIGFQGMVHVASGPEGSVDLYREASVADRVRTSMLPDDITDNYKESRGRDAMSGMAEGLGSKGSAGLESPDTGLLDGSRIYSSLETPRCPTNDRADTTDAEATMDRHVQGPTSAFDRVDLNHKYSNAHVTAVAEEDTDEHSLFVKQESYSAFANRKRSDSVGENPMYF